MSNELIFLGYILLVASSTLGALRFGKEALVALIVMQCLLANLFVTKQITLFGIDATASDALAVGVSLSLNVLQEYFGKSIALRAVWISFAAGLFYTLASLLHIAYLPSALDQCHSHFCALLTPMPRILAASLVVYLLIQQIDCRLYGALKNVLEGKHFILRNYTSVLFTQFLDTVLFSFLGLYGLVDNISSIIIFSYLVKVIVVVSATPFIAFSKRWSPA